MTTPLDSLSLSLFIRIVNTLRFYGTASNYSRPDEDTPAILKDQGSLASDLLHDLGITPTWSPGSQSSPQEESPK